MAESEHTQRIKRFLEKHNDAGLVITRLVLSNHRVHYAVASEFGQEAEDSPMVGGAVYGLSPSLDEALNQALLKAGC
jgi:hypothetical protein